jgi:L(+)-tartrate dehydratase beta subunit
VVHLETPITEEAVRGLRLGDQVTISGTVWGLRDATLINWEREGHRFPADLTEGVLLHTQPNVKRGGDGYEPVCIGTTTSQRMDRFTRSLLERLRIRAIVGKGGMSGDSATAMAEHGCVYLAVVGGAASVETLQVEAIEEVYWEHLMPECLWKLRFRDFGPLFVAIDAHGGNLHEQVTASARQRLAELLAQDSRSS